MIGGYKVIRVIKNGRYAIYKGVEYLIYNGDIDNKNAILLLSRNRDDLKKGFSLSYDEEYMKNQQFFRCEKEVLKSEITKAYEIRTHAVYKGVGASIMGCLKKDWLILRTACLYNEDKEEFLKKVNKAGFKYYGREQGGVDAYGIDVSLDDPDLQLIEKRKELDISKL